MVTRVPTTASYNLYMTRMRATQSRVNDASYQATTGQRYDSYDKYGLTTYRLLTLENEYSGVSKFLETNKITQTTLEAQEEAIDSIRTVMLDFRNELRDFSSEDLKAMTPDYSVDPPEMPTEEELANIQRIQNAAFEAMSQIAYFLNTKVDGVYIFGGGENNTPPVDFPYTTLEEFQAVFDGNFVTFPTSGSADLSSVKTGDDVTGGLEFAQNFFEMNANGTIRPTINGTATGDITFSAADNTMTAANMGSFSNLTAGSKITLTGTGANDGEKIIKSVSADGTTVTFEDATPVTDGTVQGAGLNGFNVFSSLDFRVETDPETGETVYSLNGAPGSFLDLQAGGEIEITGTANNNGTKVIKEISPDGSRIIFEDPVVEESIDGTGIALDDVIFRQSTTEGTISALNPVGAVLETYTIQAGANNLTVDAGANTITAADADTFAKIKPGQTITLDDGAGNTQTLYVKNVSADGRTLEISSDTPVTGGNITAGTVTLQTHSDIHGFIADTMKGSELKTGNISFSAAKNQMSSTVIGAFSHLKPGGTIIVQGADGNNGAKYIESVSSDGRTVTFSDETPVNIDQTITNGTGVTIARTYPVSSMLNLSDVNPSYNGNYTILGVSDDGNTLTVKTENFPKYGNSAQFAATGIQSVTSESYYSGGSLSSTHRLNETTSIELNVTAESSGFEKLFRAMGNIAQGNLLDTRNPLDTLDEVDENRAYDRVMESLDLLDEALESRPNSKEPNGDITAIQYSVVSKLDTVKSTIDNQTSLQNSLTNYISDIKTVDKTEAVIMLLQEIQNLNISYAVISQVNQLSLLNYL